MSDEGAATEPVVEPENQPSESSTPAVAKKTESSENKVPQSRLNEVIEERNKLRTELETLQAQEREAKSKAEEAKKKAELEQAEKDKDLQKQIDLLNKNLEEEQAKVLQAQKDLKKSEIDAIKAKVAVKTSLPAKFINRLVGETEEEIEADAMEMLAEMPKPSPQTPTDAKKGLNSSPTPTPTKTDAEIREEAARSGVRYEYLKAYYDKQAR